MVLRPGIFSFWLDGPHAVEGIGVDASSCIGKEVVPALKDIGRERAGSRGIRSRARRGSVKITGKAEAGRSSGFEIAAASERFAPAD